MGHSYPTDDAADDAPPVLDTPTLDEATILPSSESLTLVEMVSFRCWACDKMSAFKRYHRVLDPILLRCKPCAEKDGEFNTKQWAGILMHSDPAEMYKITREERKKHGWK